MLHYCYDDDHNGNHYDKKDDNHENNDDYDDLGDGKGKQKTSKHLRHSTHLLPLLVHNQNFLLGCSFLVGLIKNTRT